MDNNFAIDSDDVVDLDDEILQIALRTNATKQPVAGKVGHSVHYLEVGQLVGYCLLGEKRLTAEEAARYSDCTLTVVYAECANCIFWVRGCKHYNSPEVSYDSEPESIIPVEVEQVEAGAAFESENEVGDEYVPMSGHGDDEPVDNEDVEDANQLVYEMNEMPPIERLTAENAENGRGALIQRYRMSQKNLRNALSELATMRKQLAERRTEVIYLRQQNNWYASRLEERDGEVLGSAVVGPGVREPRAD